MVKGSPEFREVCTIGPIRRCIKPGSFADAYCEVGFLHRIKNYIFWFSIPVAYFDIKNALVQSLYHG